MESAVLIPLYDSDAGLTAILTRRSQKVSSHQGQISLPGGKRDETDRSIEQTALREAWEELGIEPESVELVGRLGDTFSVLGFRISPFVGLIPPPSELRPSPDEIAEVLYVPLDDLVAPGVLRIMQMYELSGREFPVYSFKWGETEIWGATARIMLDLLERIYGPLPAEGPTSSGGTV